ncbi:copper homeostasis protein CutC [Ornithinibacillus sp. 179-J 7C1 HS]|uniref:copper homeostasis protein CutC n=1 Tax=Ornithinibacillus sp. 179-J 7C1 HS TaxID=3142384 RepID=UPI0039A183CA
MIKEICVENFTRVPELIAKGAGRVELCDNLAVGGTTVSYGVAAYTIDYCRRENIPVMTMIRPRGGDFIYSNTELEIMKRDLFQMKELGASGVVFGCLNNSNWIDEAAMRSLLALSEGLEITFHMAFDQINPKDQFRAIDWLVEYGVDRILTHGGPAGSPIKDNVDRLKEYIDCAAGRIVILPGGGITEQNVDALVAVLPISEAHGTRIVG